MIPSPVRKFLAVLVGMVFVHLAVFPASAVIRDGGIDPANLGKGEWIYYMSDVTNKVGGNVLSVTNENSLMLYYKSQGIRYIMVKAATSDQLFNGTYGFPQFTSNLCSIAHSNGILIFGYNRSYGANIPAEIAIADYVFNQGADGFVFDAEAEWESNKAWIGANGGALAWQLCSTVRSNWPTKFLAHAPFPIISVHTSFPYKEFGYWCDTVMPQIYHFSSTGLKGAQSAGINWSDVNWTSWQNSLVGKSTNVGGITYYWTNAIKPLAPVNDVYGPATGQSLAGGTAAANPNKDVMEFIDYLTADPHAATGGGYKGVSFWRSDLHGQAQAAYIKVGTSGNFAGAINNIVLDSPSATTVGSWTSVKVFGATTTSPSYFGATGTDTNSFGTNYLVKSKGTGSAYVQYTPNIVTAGYYDVYEWHPYRADASTNVPFVINYSGGSTTVNANLQTNSGNWSLIGRFNFAMGTSGNIRVTDGFPEASAVALADGLKLVYATSSGSLAVVTPPQSQTVVAGQTATFNVTANGIAPINYQWRFNGANIAGATTSSYSRSNIQTNDAGNYLVVVGDISGSVTSAPAVLTVNYSLNATATVGGSVSANPSQSSYTPNSTVTLTASSNLGSTFLGWTGDASGIVNPLSITMTTNLNITANFSAPTEVIIDNTNATFVGSWSVGSATAGHYGNDYRFATAVSGTATASAIYTPTLVAARMMFTSGIPRGAIVRLPRRGSSLMMAEVLPYWLTSKSTVRAGSKLHPDLILPREPVGTLLFIITRAMQPPARS